MLERVAIVFRQNSNDFRLWLHVILRLSDKTSFSQNVKNANLAGVRSSPASPTRTAFEPIYFNTCFSQLLAALVPA
jgi:hypothetical protein